MFSRVITINYLKYLNFISPAGPAGVEMRVYLVGLNAQNVIKIWMTIIFHFLFFSFYFRNLQNVERNLY